MMGIGDPTIRRFVECAVEAIVHPTDLPVLSAGTSRSRRPPLPQTGKRTMTLIVLPHTAVVPACSGHATPAPCLPFTGLRLAVPESPASGYDYPPLNRDGDHPSANTIRSGRQSERLRSSLQLKIPSDLRSPPRSVQPSFCIGYAMQKLLIRLLALVSLIHT